VIVAAALVAGCQSTPEEFDMQGSPERIHADAARDLKSGNYQGAIQKLELLEARFPFSDPARQGQLDLLYAYYKNRETESAVDQADQFIRENPTHPRVDYAYYIRGLVYFQAGATWFERVARADISKRPPQDARKSFQSFQILVQSYPKSPYAADARQRMVFLRNRLAEYELAVARYYMKRGAYVGALNRARGLIETYDGAPAVPDALGLAANAYRKLGLNDLAQVAESVREQNKTPDIVNPAAAYAGLATGQATGQSGGMGAPAQGDRQGRWEASVGLGSANSADIDFKGGTTASVEGGTAFQLGVAYNYTDRLRFGSTFTYDQKDYEAQIAGDESGESFQAQGSLDSTTLMFDAAYSFLTGPFKPFVAGGVGWTWVDTNIATEPPNVGCWWDPWWGYVCTSWQDTKTINGLAYELGVGVRYDINRTFAADGSYMMRWVGFDNATGTPSFDTVRLSLVWKF
jgi:outer membrane protein assembly factor BamD